jgi:hypothetical protein
VLNGQNLSSMTTSEFIDYIRKESSVFWRG